VPEIVKIRVLASLLVCLALVAPQRAALAQEGAGLLRSEFWADREPVAGVGEEWPVSIAEARRRILAEAAWVYGGMVWGFEFRYTPYDKARALAERFELEPLGALAPDALNFAQGAQASSEGEFRSIVEYRPDSSLVSLMESYAADPWKGSQGIGKADMNLGIKARRAAYEDALRTAVRSYVQSLEPNKPRLARGRLVLERPPTMSLTGGYYTSQARIRVMLIEVLPYRIY
jgi:hypothetical protein